MLQFAKLVAKYRSLISVVLFAPLLSLVFSSNFHVGMVPENPYLLFDVSFSVPSRSANEIEKKVTIPSEKVFNGLPYLIGIQSETRSEFAKISLRFSEKAKASTIYLNIQEKMDRIKLMLPGDVESYEVRRREIERPADLQFSFSKPIPRGELLETLAPFHSVVSRTEPSLESSAAVRVHPLPKKLAENSLSISQVVSAMRSLGMTTSLGRAGGVMFETGRSFNSVDDIKSALVGARGHRPVLLRDVARIEVVRYPPIESLKVWVDSDRANHQEVIASVNAMDGQVKVGYPLWKAILEQAGQPVLLILLCFLLNFYVIKVLKLPASSLIFLAIMGGLVCVHFLFWKGLFGSLTVLDLHALAFTLIVGSMFLSVLYLRIRSFFSEDGIIHESGKTLDQAKLFALAELSPTFLVLVVGMWIMALPVLTSAINLPSREIFSGMFYFGFPVLFFIISFMLLSTPGHFLTQKISTPSSTIHWSLKGKAEQYGVVVVLICTVLSLFIFSRFDFGVHTTDKNDFSLSMVENFRGYGKKLEYRTEKGFDESLAGTFSPIQTLVTYPTRVFQFSPSGLSHLAGLDLLGFADSMKSLQGHLSFADIYLNESPASVEFTSSAIVFDDLPNLLLAASEPKERPKSVRALMSMSVSNVEESIFRDNMSRGDRIEFKEEVGGQNFSRDFPEEVQPTPWTSFLLEQFQRYKSYHLVSLIFLFLVLAMYLNSFIRSGLIVVFAIATAGFEMVIHELLPGTFHADSLWLANMGTFMALFQILVLARLIDIERSRGFDRDRCIQNIKATMAPGVYLCSWSFVLALFVAGATEFIPGLSTLGFWRESIAMSVTSGIILVFSAHILFPLYYLRSETVVNDIAFKFYKWKPF